MRQRSEGEGFGDGMLMRCQAEFPDDDKNSDTEIQRDDAALESPAGLYMEESKTVENPTFST